MPIVVRPENDGELKQGDILKGLAFAISGSNGSLKAHTSAKYLIVISRPCKSIRDASVVVAPVTASKLDLSQFKQQAAAKSEKVTLDRMRRFLAGIRDGGQMSDSFYLGNLDSVSASRFAADLSMNSTLEVPVDLDARKIWVNEHRVWSLCTEFARDLHVRVFNTVARLGFDDFSWYSDPDLEIMVTHGEGELAQLQLELSESERAAQALEANGQSRNSSMVEQIASKKIAVIRLESELAPYRAERDRRRTS
jgi:hypothetical protein